MGAVEQADALAEEIVDLVPAVAGGLLAYSARAGRVDGGPAAGVGADLELDFVAEMGRWRLPFGLDGAFTSFSHLRSLMRKQSCTSSVLVISEPRRRKCRA
ncbi:hypothetical protein GCM10010095_61280 [Streptomyces anthocyanicus]|nr:hypothetical protein GCM10010095_61280 [Streptomyces anthocyanicus]